MSCLNSVNYRIGVGMMLVGLVMGCSGRPSVLPNSDPALRKTSAQFAADAAKRTYPTDAPRGSGLASRAQVGYATNQIEIVNLTQAPWQNIEVWVNKSYVVAVPAIAPNQLKTLPFGMIFDAAGNSFPVDNDKTKVTSVELLLDGKMYDVTVKLAD